MLATHRLSGYRVIGLSGENCQFILSSAHGHGKFSKTLESQFIFHAVYSGGPHVVCAIKSVAGFAVNGCSSHDFSPLGDYFRCLSIVPLAAAAVAAVVLVLVAVAVDVVVVTWA